MTQTKKTEPHVGMHVEPAEFLITPKLLSDYVNGIDVEPGEHPPLMVATNADRGNSLFFSPDARSPLAAPGVGVLRPPARGGPLPGRG